jgi:hypothetical protein
MSIVHSSVKCHRNVIKETNPLQVDDLITNKSVAMLEASRRILKMQYIKINVLVA